MIPKKIMQEPRTLGLTLLITWISGANFISVILFWPTQSFNQFGHDPVGVGLRSLPVGYGILAGACITLCLLSYMKGQIKALMIGSSILMTAGMSIRSKIGLLMTATNMMQDVEPWLLRGLTISAAYGSS